MGGALEKLYSRLGIGYLLPLLAFAAIVSNIDVASFVLIGTRYLDVDPADIRRAMITALVGSNLGLVITFGLLFAILRDLITWMRGRKDPASAGATWENAVRGPARVVWLGTSLVALGDLPAVIYIARTAGFDIEVAFMSAAVVAATLAGGLVILVAAEIWIRPVIEEIGASVPRGFEPTINQRPISRRLVVFIVLVSFLSPFYVVGVIGRSATASGRVIGTMTAATAIAFTFGLLFSLAVARMVGSPVHALLRATRAVRAGRLDVHVVPTGNDEIGELARSFNDMVDGLVERETLHSALGTYVDPVIVDRLLAEGEVLEGDEVDATIMFVDIVGYTMRVEDMRPRDVVAELNGFFQSLIPIINAHRGHTNKLLGDGLMAVFGAPVSLDDHADRALAAAYALQTELRERYGGSLRAGIGLNSGPVVVGTTGGGSKLDFTVIGDAVNVASRIEALTRETGDEILLSEATHQRLTGPLPAILARGATTIKGRTAPVRIFAAITRPD